MSFWVAGATVVSAGVSADSANKASKSASRANKASLDFEKEKYANWEATYGNIEDNLGRYYSTMTPDSYAAKGVVEFNKQNEAALENIRTSLAQRGMLDSGVAAAVTLQSQLGGAEKKANIRATAEDVVASEKKDFLSIGLGQNPGASYSSALAGQAAQASRDAAAAEASAGQAIGTAISTVGKAAADYKR